MSAEHEPRPRDFGRDGVSGLVNESRAMRARDVSQPRPEDIAEAEAVADELIARSRNPGRQR